MNYANNNFYQPFNIVSCYIKNRKEIYAHFGAVLQEEIEVQYIGKN